MFLLSSSAFCLTDLYPVINFLLPVVSLRHLTLVFSLTFKCITADIFLSDAMDAGEVGGTF